MRTLRTSRTDSALSSTDQCHREYLKRPDRGTEYLLRGASSFQIHTYFQLPSSEYKMETGWQDGPGSARTLFPSRAGPDRVAVASTPEFDWPTDWNIKEMAEFCVDPKKPCLVFCNGVGP